MRHMCNVLFAVAISALETAVGAEAISPSAVVWADPSESLFWKTVCKTTVKVSVDWPEDAVKAVLTASKGGKELSREMLTDKSVKVKTLSFGLPQTESEESVLDLALTFFDSSDAPLADAARTASVGLVRGIGDEPFRLIPDGEQNGQWKKVRKSAVAPVYADTTSVTFDGAPLAFNGTPGWTYLAGVSPALHSLVLMPEAGNPVAVPIVGVGGLFIVIK